MSTQELALEIFEAFVSHYNLITVRYCNRLIHYTSLLHVVDRERHDLCRALLIKDIIYDHQTVHLLATLRNKKYNKNLKELHSLHENLQLSTDAMQRPENKKCPYINFPREVHREFPPKPERACSRCQSRRKPAVRPLRPTPKSANVWTYYHLNTLNALNALKCKTSKRMWLKG